MQAAARAGRKEPQVVAHLREAEHARLQGSGHRREAIEVLGRVEEVGCLDELLAEQAAKAVRDVCFVIRRRVDSGADRRRAEVDDVHLIEGPADPLPAAVHHDRVPVERITERHRDRVLELRAAHFADVTELVSLLVERVLEPLQLGEQRFCKREDRHFTGGRDRVVRRLRHIHVVVRMDLVVRAALPAEELVCPVRDDLVHVHVGTRAGTALYGIKNKGVGKLPFEDLLTGCDDRITLLLREESRLVVYDGGSFLDKRKITKERLVHLIARDLKILFCPQRLYAVVRRCRHVQYSDRIRFHSRDHASSPLLHRPAGRLSADRRPFSSPVTGLPLKQKKLPENVPARAALLLPVERFPKAPSLLLTGSYHRDPPK